MFLFRSCSDLAIRVKRIASRVYLYCDYGSISKELLNLKIKKIQGKELF